MGFILNLRCVASKFSYNEFGFDLCMTTIKLITTTVLLHERDLKYGLNVYYGLLSSSRNIFIWCYNFWRGTKANESYLVNRRHILKKGEIKKHGLGLFEIFVWK
jgi:hypothetical protein